MTYRAGERDQVEGLEETGSFRDVQGAAPEVEREED